MFNPDKVYENGSYAITVVTVGYVTFHTMEKVSDLLKSLGSKIGDWAKKDRKPAEEKNKK